jgi:DnaJ domain
MLNSDRNARTYGRRISTETAMRMLGFPNNTNAKQLDIREVRTAYLELAKRTHPDLQNRETADTSVDFRDITEAYEHLLKCEISKNGDPTLMIADIISKEEENLYRQACLNLLGIPAEIVEESKHNPMFRHWLGGNTDGAQHWRAFFAVHGGLAQKLRTPVAYLEGGSGHRPPFETRRRRGKK